VKNKLILLAVVALIPSATWAQTYGGVAKSGFDVDISGANENPPVTTDVTGTANVSIDFQVEGATNNSDNGLIGDVGEAVQSGFNSFVDLFTGDNVGDNSSNSRSVTIERGNITAATVRMCVSLDNTNGAQAVMLTAAHFHKGAPGENGPVVFGFDLPQTTLNANEQRRTCTTKTTSDSSDIDALLDIRSNPSNYYFNIHSQSNPNGILRGQVRLDQETQTSRLSQQLDRLSRMVMEIHDNINEVDFAALRSQLNRNADLIAAIARKNGLVADSPAPVGSAN